MADDKELEIRLQFLDEAQEYLDTLESRLMGLTQGFDGETINDALRAAHSIKGGAALMSFQKLSEMAHRLEDGLKVLKVQRNKITVDASLEQHLLAAVDCMGQVMKRNRLHLSQDNSSVLPVDETWLNEQVEPIFEHLHERLGDPEDEDAHSILTPEDNQDIIPLLFQSEVEGCLQRLESVLAEDSPCLREEVQILSQELGGLGEMLQLEAFTQLCQSIGAQIDGIAESELVPITQAALDIWRQAQTMVLNGNIAEIPNQFTGSEDHPLEPLSEEQLETLYPTQADLPDDLDRFSDEDDEVTDPLYPTSTMPASDTSSDIFEASEIVSGMSEAVDTDDFSFDEFGSFDDSSQGVSDFDTVEPDPQMSPPSGETFQAETEPDPDSTVRVPVKQINQLSDLFGELIIERNRLEMEVKRMRNLMATLQGRMRTLDYVNGDLRNAYDRVATQEERPFLKTDPAPEENELNQQFDVLELDRYRDMHLPFREIIETIVQLQEVGDDIDLSLDHTEQTTRSLRKTSRQLQKYLTQLRMRPLSDIFDRFPRALRQMSLQYDKPVELKLHGARTRVDRNILESLQEPLMHIIRNCFDHGIEERAVREQQSKPVTGTISISAYQQSGRTIIRVQDDGGGIPLDKVRDRACQMGLDEALLASANKQDLLSLIFEPGFSTASEVTDLSGRGVGMDVVRSKLKEIRGDIQVDTEAGVGTTFTLSIPFTMSVTRVLIVESRGMRLAFPVDAVEEMFALTSEQILSTAGKDSFEWNGELLQLVKLSDWLHFNCPRSLESPEIPPIIGSPTVLLVHYNQRPVGIQIDRSWGEQEIALRRVVGDLPMPIGFNSCTILGDGQVVPLVSVPELLYWIASCEASGTSTAADLVAAYLPSKDGNGAEVVVPRRPTVLLVDDSINVRRFMALTLEKAGYQVAQAKDGQDALDKLSAGLEVEAVICDVEMPRLDGYGFLARLKAKGGYEHLPVTMLTSRSSQKHRQMAMKLGAAAYFTKPYNEQTLLQTLEELIQPALVS
ncbi:MAG: response regulator [Leptolyngbya sp. SIO1D8]|nr:response regulator [Leptolyngbya sp. SIO1D8]